MRIHFIAIGGSAMHNLAIALQCNDYTITGSDDEIYNPARDRLAKYGLLPTETQAFFERAHGLGQAMANHQETPLPIRYFSMGMSQDFPLAIAAGANVIRLGTTLFGSRE